MLRRLYPMWRPAARATLGGVLLLMLAALLELLQPWPIKWLVDCVFGSLPAPALLGWLWPPLGTGDAAGSIAGVCLAIVLLAVSHRLISMMSQRLLIRSGSRMVQELRCRLSDHLHRLSLAYHDRAKVGGLMYRVAYDTQAAQTLFNGALVPIATGIFILLGIVLVMSRIDPLLTLVALAVAPLFWVAIRIFGRRLEERSGRYHEDESRLVSTVQESLSAIRVVQAFTGEQESERRFRSEAGQSVAANDRLIGTQLAFSACVGVAMALGTAAVLWVGALGVLDGRLLVGDILVFLAYLGMLYHPMNSFSQGASVLRSSLVQLRRVFQVLDVAPVITDRPGALRLPAVRGRIEFRRVSFEYEGGHRVLQDIDLSIEPGQVVALVGRTGAGKTTLSSLLLRFYDPTRGSVLLDGHDLRELELGWLRRQVSVVLQDAVLFSTTIRDNIAYGRPNARVQEIEEAARLAQADGFIRRLPEGYDTVLGERGVNLSGGQRQRLAIARAFLKNAPILVLDEPTAAVDARTEERLLAALRHLMSGRTTLIIAHRLSTVRHADLILVLDGGSIVERGSHEQLMRGETAYARLYRSQWGIEWEWEPGAAVGPGTQAGEPV